jgi:hypothetical protein
MQPCGYVVDWSRRPYTCFARFTTDPNERPGKLIFYGSNGPALPFPTVFNVRWWNTEILGTLPLGGQVPRPRGYNGLWSVPGLVFNHYCGTPDQFLNGYDPATNPPTPPGPGIIPPCCPSALGGRVSAAGYPSSVVTVTRSYTYPPTGGLSIRAAVIPVTQFRYPPVGGLSIRSFVVPVLAYRYPPTGGLSIRSFVVPVLAYRYPPTGGLSIRSFVVPFTTYLFPPTGGLSIRSFVVPFMIGSISTQNQTGGPIPLTNALLFIGGSGVVLQPDGNNITFAAAIGPAPAGTSTLTVVPGSGQNVLQWTAASGASQYAVYLGTQQLYFGNGLSFTHSGLTNGTTYTYTLYPYNNGLAGASASGSGTPYATRILDTFHAANQSNNGRAPDTIDVPGSTWETIDGTMSVVSDTLQETAAGSQGATTLISNGQAARIITVGVTFGAATGRNILYVHLRSDGTYNNYLYVQLEVDVGSSTNPDAVLLNTVVGGSATNIAAASVTYGSGTPYTVTIVDTGSAVSVYLNNMAVLSNVATTVFATNSVVGVQLRLVPPTGVTPTQVTLFEVS